MTQYRAWAMGAAAALASALQGAPAGAEPMAANSTLKIAAIPYELQAQTEHGSASMTDGTLVLAADKGTDLFAETDGASIADNTPRVLFAPAGDFIFSAKVTAGFHKEYDGAALIVYGDKAHWAKLLFEFGKSGQAGISTTVAKGAGDDAHHGVRDGQVSYLKVARRKDMFVFYTSPDGQHWNMVRSFGLPSATPIRLGFSSQSPVGERFSAQFSEIVFRPVGFKDFWQGE